MPFFKYGEGVFKDPESGTELTIARFDDGRLIANNEAFNIRQIQNIELVRGNDDMVNVFIGYEDPKKQTMFSRIGVDRIFAGTTHRSSDVYEFFRNQVRNIGVPVIDLST